MISLTTRAYYTLKPLIPQAAALAIRRWRAARLRKRFSGVWPIDESAGATPSGWPGWPGNHRFAFVLTHDVEGPTGLDRIDQLIRLEAKYGFRSCVNFVPEGSYRVPDELIRRVREAGCEVGIHGLRHDGKLYSSKRVFSERAKRIRHYFETWGASGFRSPFMHHNLAWLHEVGAAYDSSTFDTDPFEPQPDGVRTIFPFWVGGRDGAGYVELPYTLVQDLTLFKVLGEAGPDIWKRKLDWIAARGGMALLNTHPDYMNFDGKSSSTEYPISLYEEFLQYVQERYRGDFWHALPGEVSRFYRENIAVESRNSRKKICMVTHSNYAGDNRVRRYAEALTGRGDDVDVIAISTDGSPLGEQEIDGVRVFQVQQRAHNERSQWTYAYRLLRFLFVSGFHLTRLHRGVRYDLIHVHNIPDFVVFSALYPKWTGSKVILDIHDIVPELFGNKFKTRAKSLYFSFLQYLEKISAAFANHVIISNHLWYDTIVSRSAAREKCSVFLNHVDRRLFYRRERTRKDDRLVILFHGTFQWHQGLDIAVDALSLLQDRFPNAELHLYGGGGGADTQGRLAEQAARLGIGEKVKFFPSVPLQQVAEIVANADLGVVPKRADSFGNEAYSTKIMEFMSQGVPVVVSRTKIDEYYFDESVVRFFPSGDSEAMAAAIAEVLENGALRERLVKAATVYVERNSWTVKKAEYLELVDRLTTESF